MNKELPVLGPSCGTRVPGATRLLCMLTLLRVHTCLQVDCMGGDAARQYTSKV